MEKFENISGFSQMERDENWDGLLLKFDRGKAKILPSLLEDMNNGISFIKIEKEPSFQNISKLKEFFSQRKKKVLKRMEAIGKKGVKSLLTKGMRWAVDTAFGDDKDMKVSEFSGVFSFADPTVIDFDDFNVALKTMKDFSDAQIRFWKTKDSGRFIISTIECGGGAFSKSVVSKIKTCDYLSDEGRKVYGAIGCISNYAWARRQMLSGIMEMSAYDAFGKSTSVEKITDISLTIIFDDGTFLVYKKNFPHSSVGDLFKKEGFLLKTKKSSYRMVQLNG